MTCLHERCADTFSALALIILLFFVALFSVPTSSSLAAGRGGGAGGRGFWLILADFETDFSFFDGLLATLADLPIVLDSRLYRSRSIEQVLVLRYGNFVPEFRS
jgi:hypothetical protein